MRDQAISKGAPLFGVRLEHEVGINSNTSKVETSKATLEKLRVAAFESPESRRMKVLTKINGIIQEHQVFKRNTVSGRLGNVIADFNFEVLNRVFNFFAADLDPAIVEKLQYYQQGTWLNYQKLAIENEKVTTEQPKVLPKENHWTDPVAIQGHLTEPEQAIQVLDMLAASMLIMEEVISKLSNTLDNHLNESLSLFLIRKTNLAIFDYFSYYYFSPGIRPQG